MQTLIDRYTSETIRAMRKWEPGAAGAALDGRARQLDREGGEWYVEVGLICCEIEDRWDFLQLCDGDGNRFPHFSAWLEDAMPRSQSSAREAKTKVRECSKDIPEVDLRQIPPSKIKHLANCSTAARRDPEVIRDAKDRKVTEKQFVDRVNLKHDQHLEVRGPYVTPDESQKAIYDQACEIVRRLHQDPNISREDCFEEIAVFFISSTGEAGVDKIVLQMAEAAGRVQ